MPDTTPDPTKKWGNAHTLTGHQLEGMGPFMSRDTLYRITERSLGEVKRAIEAYGHVIEGDLQVEIRVSGYSKPKPPVEVEDDDPMCMCGLELSRHRYVEDHGFVSQAEYFGDRHA